MLSKKSIRSDVKIYIDSQLVNKDYIINLSEKWSEKEEIIFRKLLKQGGNFAIQGKKFYIIPEEKFFRNDGKEDEIINLPKN
jgi:hypothetical protein